MSKPKVGFYWCASCGGCEEAIVDLAEDILAVVDAVDISFWPVALDFKREDVEKMKDGEMAVGFVNGAIRTSEQCEMATLMREKSGVLIAFGSCSHLGGIPGLANLHDRKTIFDKVYFNSPSVANKEKTTPQPAVHKDDHDLELPIFWDTVKSLSQVVEVDYFLPGCAPPVGLIKNALKAILDGKLPEKGSVLAPDIALCNTCPRKDTKPENLLLKEFKRPHWAVIDSTNCLLAQGILCMGASTRSGCEAACITANMPCTGCLGPTGKIKDYGAKALSAIASMVDSTEADEITSRLDQIADPVGTFYRYSLPSSLLHRRKSSLSRGGGSE